MAIIKWAPMTGLSDVMDRFFEDNWGMANFGQANFMPAVDVYQTKDEVIVETPLAGIDPEQVDIAIVNGVLTIKGRIEKKSEVDDKDYYRQEVRTGSFYRSIALPARVAGDQAKACYEKGVLKVVIPKVEEVKPQAIKIEVK